MHKNIFKIVFSLLALILSYISASAASNNEFDKVYAVYDKGKVGEMAMANAVIEALKIISPKTEIEVQQNATFSDLAIDASKKYLLVTAGQFGVNLTKNGVPSNVKVLLSAHQWFDDMNDLHDITITLPNHEIDETVLATAQKQNLKLIPTLGVLHTMTQEELDKQDSSAIHLTDARIGLVIGGDAEMRDGKAWKLYTKEDAQKLALEVAAVIKKTGYKALIANGPRTNKFIKLGVENGTAHRDGVLDEVSKAFLQTLESAGLEAAKDFEFFDFQFGKPSQLKPIMKIVQKNKGFMVAPGESTSMITEMVAVMPTVVFEHSAMNDGHHNFTNVMGKGGLLRKWPNFLPDIATLESYKPHKTEALDVVKKLLD